MSQFPSGSELNPPKSPFSLPVPPLYSSDTKVPPLSAIQGYVPPLITDDNYWISLGRNGGLGPRDSLEFTASDDPEIRDFERTSSLENGKPDYIGEPSFSSILDSCRSLPAYFDFGSPDLDIAYRRPDFDAYYSTPVHFRSKDVGYIESDSVPYTEHDHVGYGHILFNPKHNFLTSPARNLGSPDDTVTHLKALPDDAFDFAYPGSDYDLPASSSGFVSFFPPALLHSALSSIGNLLGESVSKDGGLVERVWHALHLPNDYDSIATY